jgi:hypothetical protein
VKNNHVVDSSLLILYENYINQQEEQNFTMKIRINEAQIFYSKSRLFSYFILNFDLLNNSTLNNNNKLNVTTFNNNKKPAQLTNCQFNNLNDCLAIIDSSLDGNTLIIENNHRILDFDLSEWTIRREIKNEISKSLIKTMFRTTTTSNNSSIFNSLIQTSNLKKSKSENSLSTFDLINNLSIKHPKNRLLDEPAETESASNRVIEFKFPKGFRLKRRTKLNLLANSSAKKDKNPSTFSPPSLCNQIKNKSSYKSASFTNLNNTIAEATTTTSRSSIKCTCCSCMLTTNREGTETESLNISDVNNWGTGLLVVTKFINNKNLTKFVNYKCIKHIWLNTQKETTIH